MATTGKVIGLGILGFLALTFLIVLGTMWGLGVGWFAGEANIRSFGNVREVYRDTYDSYNSMQQIANNVCLSKEALASAKDGADDLVIQQRESQLIATEQTYNREAGNYNAEMADHFRAKQVKPGDLPRVAPTLGEALESAGCP